ncbi:dihydroorotase [Cesiribacter andamanensis]|uniref:Dihydroorotase n=1 Tax=Cesiribacter andamanensis AMV16 TaxID=1279009 RepID=M7NBC3_9BACT|nr:dihydroorotase [Cesiribacter andamanensis]EMR04577.1 Dihydroorotase [Cesiribacter andamanensis AMV16]
MKILLKNVRVLHPGFGTEPHHLLLDGGAYRSIWPSAQAPAALEADQVIHIHNLHLSAGWCDLRASFGEPGLEYKEDLDSGCQAAAAGGFTDVLLMPNTEPVIDTKNGVRFILNHTTPYPVRLHVAAAITAGAKGEYLTEVLDLHQAGARAFTDGAHPLSDPALVVRALQYLQKIGGVFMNQAQEPRLMQGGQMHEGINSTLLGMKGIPSLAEEVALLRDIELLRYAGGRMHISCLSTAAGVALVRKAKAEGLALTADVAMHNLLFTDAALLDFDTNFKLDPPLRSEQDRQALLEGLREGTIDAIVTDHRPEDTENKRLEFDLAAVGATGLQTAYAALSALPELPQEVLIEKLTSGPRRVLGLPQAEIKEGAPACCTLFVPDAPWRLDGESNRSHSQNSPYWQQELRGKAVGIIVAQKMYLDESSIRVG